MTVSEIQARIAQLNPGWAISILPEGAVPGARIVVHAKHPGGGTWQSLACPYPASPGELEALARFVHGNLK